MTSVVFQPFAFGAGVCVATMTGGVVSCTITVKLPVAILPVASVAVQFTVLVPTGNVLPEGGVQFTVGSGSSSSVADTEYVATAPDGLVASTVTVSGKANVGDVESGGVHRQSGEWSAAGSFEMLT